MKDELLSNAVLFNVYPHMIFTNNKSCSIISPLDKTHDKMANYEF